VGFDLKLRNVAYRVKGGNLDTVTCFHLMADLLLGKR